MSTRIASKDTGIITLTDSQTQYAMVLSGMDRVSLERRINALLSSGMRYHQTIWFGDLEIMLFDATGVKECQE